jgi:hypothetical protein
VGQGYLIEMLMFGMVTDDGGRAGAAWPGPIGATGAKMAGNVSVDCPVAFGFEPTTVTTQVTFAPPKSIGAVYKPFGCFTSDCCVGLTVRPMVTEPPGVDERA